MGCDEVDIRDNRYHQVVHMGTSAKGAEQYYTIEHHTTRLEGLEEARERDTKAAEAWIGHPYVDIIDNKMDFESKINRLISCVAAKMGIDIGDRLNVNAKKVKFAVTGPLPKDSAFPNFRDFEVVHHYLQTASRTASRQILVHPHHPQTDGRSGDRGEDPAHPSRLLPLGGSGGPASLDDQQDPPVLHVQQPIFPTGYLQGALPSKVPRVDSSGNLHHPFQRRVPRQTAKVPRGGPGGHRR